MKKHLNSKQYYEDLYDHYTVDFCRELESRYNESIKNKVGEKMSKKDKASLIAHNLMMYFKTGERYLEKENTIKEWMEQDKAEDTLFNNDEKWVIEPELCGECGAELSVKNERKGNKIITYYNCPKCDFKKVEELDLSIKETKKKIDKFFDRDKTRFCLSDKEGQEYSEAKRGLEWFKKIKEDIDEREGNKEIYEKASELKKLTIVELEKLLIPVLEKEGYIKFELGKPDMSRDVFIEFFIRDEKSGREDHDSRINLKKIIDKTLKDTNWRLMSEGISYRLGFLTGRLRAYEREEDLIKLVE